MSIHNKGRLPGQVAAQQKRTYHKLPQHKSHDKMNRVNRQTPCPVCSKTDWCLVSPDGSAAICKRTPEGSVKKCGDAGFLHILRENNHRRQGRPRYRTRRLTVGNGATSDHVATFTSFASTCSKALSDEPCQRYADELGVSPESLRRLRVGWMFQDRYTWPMGDAAGRIIGLRVRTSTGKYCVKGSKTGLFLPLNLSDQSPLLICEGNTDAAAGLSLGFETVGRPSCNSGVAMLKTLCRGRDVVVISDRDEKPDGSCPGQDGARALAEKLVFACPSVRIVMPPEGTKDLRGWLQAGLTQTGLQTVIDSTEPLRLEATC